MADLNINTTTAKGLEKVIGVVAKFTIKAQKKTRNFFYGSQKPPDPNASKFRNALNKGSIKILEDISDVDFCNILNYLTNSVKIGDIKFNPENPPGEDATAIEKKLWPIQKKAFDYQKIIDKYYAQYGTASGPDSRLGLQSLLIKVDIAIDAISEGIKNPDLSKNFPEISVVGNFLTNAKKKINDYGDIQNIPIEEVQDILSWISKFRQILIAVQAINSPAALISSIGGSKLQEQFQKINELVDAPGNLIPRLKDLIKLIRNINSVATTVLRYINLTKSIVQVVLVIIRLLQAFKLYLEKNPLPNIYTTLGITSTINKFYQEVLTEEGTKKLLKRLRQINLVLALMVQFVTILVTGINRILIILKAILLNLQSCKNTDKDDENGEETSLQKELSTTIADLESTVVPLQEFLNQANDAQNRMDSTFGEYTIEIIKEQLTDEGVTLKRRYGIARNNQNTIVVQSTPTFASLDLIIINEVKSLLSANGFVKTGLTDLSSEDQLTIMEASKYLQTPEYAGSSSVASPADTAATQDISKFVDNLSGGKAFRDNIRKKMKQNNSEFAKNTNQAKSSPPNQI